MNLRDKVLFLYLIPLCISSLGLCSCNRHMVDARNDIEIYVGASSLPVEYQRKGEPRIRPFTDFPIYNTVIFYPEHKVYTFQVSNCSSRGKESFIPELVTGSYVTRNDTIICIPDMVYKKNPEDLTDYNVTASDSTNLQYEPSLRPIYFQRVSKDELRDITPSYGELFDTELDIIYRETGYVWTIEDYEFNKISREKKKRLNVLSDKEKILSDKEKVFPNGVKVRQEETYRAYHRVPFKVKNEIVKDRYHLDRRAVVKYYKPVKQ